MNEDRANMLDLPAGRQLYVVREREREVRKREEREREERECVTERERERERGEGRRPAAILQDAVALALAWLFESCARAANTSHVVYFNNDYR